MRSTSWSTIQAKIDVVGTMAAIILEREKISAHCSRHGSMRPDEAGGDEAGSTYGAAGEDG